MKIAKKQNCFFLIFSFLILINLCIIFFCDFFSTIPVGRESVGGRDS